jgi:hypothetical protein
MNIKTLLPLLSVLFVLLLVNPVYPSNGQMEGSREGPIYFGSSKDKKVDYQLQEQCRKQCDEWFKKSYGDGYVSKTHRNHYNQKLKKCFILVTTKNTKLTTNNELYDVNEDKIYGSFIKGKDGLPLYCKFVGKECKTEDEWKQLIKPYMEE